MTITYPNPLPFKLQVLHALTDALKSITPANGYQFDLSDFDPGDGVMTPRVYRGRMFFGDSDPIPMLSILEGVTPGDDPAEPPVNAVVSTYPWEILIQGFLQDDKQNPTDPAYVLLADVRRRLIQEKKRRSPDGHGGRFILGFNENLVTDLQVGPGVVRPADDVSEKAWFWVSLAIDIVDNADRPYG